MKIPIALLRMRRLVQCAVLLLFCALPYLNSNSMHNITGNLYAISVFTIPFADPLAALQVGATGHMPDGLLLFGAALVLVLAFTLGRFFCGWLCPYALFSEWLWLARGRRHAPLREGAALTLRLGIVALGLAGVFLFAFPALNALSTPGLISLAPQMLSEGQAALWLVLALPLVLLVAEAATGSRLWCRYVCPQSLLLMLAAQLGKKISGAAQPGISWSPKHCSCGKESPCAKACSLGLQPRHSQSPSPLHCVQCGDCVRVCTAFGGALNLTVGGKNKPKPRQP